MKPVEYTNVVRGFGTWRIAYVPDAKVWRLSYSVRAQGNQWISARDFPIAETAAIAVGDRVSGVSQWDHLRFPSAGVADLNNWKSDASDGTQADAIE